MNHMHIFIYCSMGEYMLSLVFVLQIFFIFRWYYVFTVIYRELKINYYNAI